MNQVNYFLIETNQYTPLQYRSYTSFKIPPQKAFPRNKSAFIIYLPLIDIYLQQYGALCVMKFSCDLNFHPRWIKKTY